MTDIAKLIARACKTQHGFTGIKKAAGELLASLSPKEAAAVAAKLFAAPEHQARMLAVFVYGGLAVASPQVLRTLRTKVSRDEDWRVQEVLAQAFDRYCASAGYKASLPAIQSWLADKHANVRRAASEGLRIWTARPYFREHPEYAIRLLAALRADESEYVRKSAGNALRDISRKHANMVASELRSWDLSDVRVKHTHTLASKFLD